MKKVGVSALVVMVVVLTPLLVHLFVTGEKVVSSEAPLKALVAMILAKIEGLSGVGNVGGAKIQEADVAYITEVQDASSEMNGEWLGVCKKNSIHSVADFQRTVENDAVLAGHFSGFNWENARLGKQDEELFVYVSHRKGDVIKQTSKPIRLPKGDGYITDGVRVARTYCCNDINITPSAGAPKKPQAAETPPAILPMEKSLEGPNPYSELIVPPMVTGHSSRYPIDEPDIPPVQPVPEPGTLVLMGTGLAVLAAACRKRKR